MSAIKTVFGAGSLPDGKEAVQKILQLLEANDVKNLDTAQLYTGSEELLGASGAGQRFIIDTKWPGGYIPGTSKKDDIVRRGQESIKSLKIGQVDIFYIHRSVEKEQPIEDTLAGVNEVYKAGLFRRFGISNFTKDEVIATYEYCKEHGYPLPTAYQGPYNAFGRASEEELFPTLRQLGIPFYAYSPAGGGFLTKSKEEIEAGAGRFDPSTPAGKVYRRFFGKSSFVEALAKWEAIAKTAGCSRADLANRWVKFNSALKPEHGDAIIIGARTIEQLEATLKGLEAGPLDASIVEQIDEMWQSIKHEAQTYMFE